MEEGLLSLVEMLQENYYLQEMVLGPALRVPTPALGLLEPPWGGPGPSQPPAFCNQPGGPSPAEVTSQRRAACQRRGGGAVFPVAQGNPKKAVLSGPYKPFCRVALK